jgi:hypothetical protein
MRLSGESALRQYQLIPAAPKSVQREREELQRADARPIAGGCAGPAPV